MKLRVMEAIWEDLSRDDDQIESPGWHHQALQETDQRLRSGQEKIIDWDDAKAEKAAVIDDQLQAVILMAGVPPKFTLI